MSSFATARDSNDIIEVKNMEKVISVGIIGQGRSGRGIHGKYLASDPRFRITAVADLLPERRERAEREYGCRSYCDYREMINNEQLDLVVNATTSEQHFEVARQVLKLGKNLISEKPASKTAEQVRELIKTAAEQGVFFAFFQQSRNAPYFVQAKKVADSGVLGRIVYVRISFDGFARRWDWQTMQSKCAGSLYNTGPHPLDQALRFLDYDGKVQVFCHMDNANSYGDAEDFVKVLLKAPGRPLVEVNCNSTSAYPDPTYMIQGTCGSLSGTMSHMDWKYFDPKTAPEHTLVKESMVDAEGLPAYCGEQLDWVSESWDVPPDDNDLFKSISKRYYSMVYDVLVNGGELTIKPEQAVQQIEIIEECHRQNPMPVKY